MVFNFIGELNGQVERFKCWKETVLGSGRDHSSRGFSWLGYWLVVITGCTCIVGCTTLKKAAIVSSLGTTGALVGNAVSGTAGLVVGGLTTAAVVDIATEVAIKDKSRVTTMGECAPDNFWSLLGSLVEMGGWLLILIFVAPMILGWILPGPLEKKKKKDS